MTTRAPTQMFPTRRSDRHASMATPMEFELSEEQRLMRDATRDFAAREIAPRAAELDKLEL